MTTPELIWLYHEETVADMRENEPRKLRKYLIDVGDLEALRIHDNAMIKSGTKT